MLTDETCKPRGTKEIREEKKELLMSTVSDVEETKKE